MTLFFTTFIMVFLLGFQQQNVMHKHYYLAAITSFLIGMTQVLLYKGIMYADVTEAILLTGFGGSLGITLSIYSHNKMREKYAELFNH